MPKVIIWRDDAIEAEFDPTHRDWRIGRSETNDIALMDPRKSVSRFHAELREENGAWYFIDLNSQNGSWHVGERVTRLPLVHDLEVSFGDYRLVFVDPPAVPAMPVPVAGIPDPATTEAVAAAPPPSGSPDETLLLPSSRKEGAPVSPPAGSPVIRRRAAEPVGTSRKGINPIVLIAFLLAMVGAVAAVGFVAYSILTGEPPATDAVAVVPPEPAPPAEPTPILESAGEAAPASADPPPADVPSDGAGSGVSKRAGTEAAPATPVRTPRTPRKQAPPPVRVPPEVEEQYGVGRRALTAERFGEAAQAFEQVLSAVPAFRDTEQLLARARDGQAEALALALADGERLEQAGEWSASVAAYDRAGARERAAAARAKMHAAGDDAYRKARQFDARNRAADAIGWYERAAEWLPAEDARRETARARLIELKGGAE